MINYCSVQAHLQHAKYPSSSNLDASFIIMMGIITYHIMPPCLHLDLLRDGIKSSFSSFRLDISESPVGPAIEKKERHNPSPNLLDPIIPRFQPKFIHEKNLHLEQLQSEFLHILAPAAAAAAKKSKIKTKRKKKRKNERISHSTPQAPLIPPNKFLYDYHRNPYQSTS